MQFPSGLETENNAIYQVADYEFMFDGIDTNKTTYKLTSVPD
jgi:hypothetical protein